MKIQDFKTEWILFEGKPFMQVVRNAELERVMSAGTYRLFNDFMRGQTVPLPDGVYTSDLIQFLKGGAPLD